MFASHQSRRCRLSTSRWRQRWSVLSARSTLTSRDPSPRTKETTLRLYDRLCPTLSPLCAFRTPESMYLSLLHAHVPHDHISHSSSFTRPTTPTRMYQIVHILFRHTVDHHVTGPSFLSHSTVPPYGSGRDCSGCSRRRETDAFALP